MWGCKAAMPAAPTQLTGNKRYFLERGVLRRLLVVFGIAGLRLVLLDGIKGNLVRHERGDVGRLRHREVGRQVAVEQAGSAQLGEARQVLDAFQTEVTEERFRGAVGDRAPRRTAAS